MGGGVGVGGTCCAICAIHNKFLKSVGAMGVINTFTQKVGLNPLVSQTFYWSREVCNKWNLWKVCISFDTQQSAVSFDASSTDFELRTSNTGRLRDSVIYYQTIFGLVRERMLRET